MAEGEKAKSPGLLKLLVNAPSTFWIVGLVQFFCWFAFLFMWTYTNGTIAKNAFDCPETTTILALEQKDASGKVVSDYSAKFILDADSSLVVANGKAMAAGIMLADGAFIPAKSVEIIRTDVESVTAGSSDLAVTFPTRGIPMNQNVLADGAIASVGGVSDFSFGEAVDTRGAVVVVNGTDTVSSPSITPCDYLSRMNGPTGLILADIYTTTRIPEHFS